jgi:uncharacterized protein YebE (UPF0316 family)
MQRLKALCFCSLTMAWSYVLIGCGLVLNNLDAIAAVVTDAQVSASVAGVLGMSPKALGAWTAAIGIITTAARVRGLMKR